MSRGAAALEEAILIQHSIKGGADFPAPTRQTLLPQKSTNEWKENENDEEVQTYKRASAGARFFARWLFWIFG